MEMLYKAILYSHLVGFAAVAGGLIFQLASKYRKIGPIILNGARWQVISGLILYIMLGDNANHIAAGLKIVGALIILTLAELNRKKDKIPPVTYYSMLAVVAVQVFLALYVSKN